MVEVAAQEHTADRVVAHRIATELECFTQSAILGSATPNHWHIGDGLGQSGEKGVWIEIIRIGKNNEEVVRAQVWAHAVRYGLSRLASTSTQLRHEEAFYGKHIRAHGEHGDARSALDFSVAGEDSTRAAPHDMGRPRRFLHSA